MLYILLGQDDFSLRQSLEEIKRGIGDQALLAINTITIEGQKATSDQLKTICETVPFLVEKRLVIIEGLLERFESKGKPSQKKKAGKSASQQDEYKSLVACLSKIPESTVVVLIDGKIKTSNPLYKELSAAKAEVRSFLSLSDSRLRQWIQQRVTVGGGAISSEAVKLLIELVGSNLWVMSSEIDKLNMFASGRRIEEGDVKAVVSSAREANVFTMVDVIIERKLGVAEQLLEQLLQEGVAPTHLLWKLSQQLQMIVRAKELKNQRKSKAEIQNRLGLAEFAVRKTLEQAEKYSWEQIKNVYNKLLEADTAIKTGKYADELALNILVAELCQ